MKIGVSGASGHLDRAVVSELLQRPGSPVLRMLCEVVGMTRVLFGTDFPYLRRDLAVTSTQRVSRSLVLDDAERRAVLGGNAAHLFPRLRSLTGDASLAVRDTVPRSSR